VLPTKSIGQSECGAVEDNDICLMTMVEGASTSRLLAQHLPCDTDGDDDMDGGAPMLLL